MSRISKSTERLSLIFAISCSCNNKLRSIPRGMPRIHDFHSMTAIMCPCETGGRMHLECSTVAWFSPGRAESI